MGPGGDHAYETVEREDEAQLKKFTRSGVNGEDGNSGLSLSLLLSLPCPTIGGAPHSDPHQTLQSRRWLVLSSRPTVSLLLVSLKSS